MSNFAANQIYRIMYSSEDLERFYFQYQTEALPHGEVLLRLPMKKRPRLMTGLNLYQEAVMTIPSAYG